MSHRCWCARAHVVVDIGLQDLEFASRKTLVYSGLRNGKHSRALLSPLLRSCTPRPQPLFNIKVTLKTHPLLGIT